MKKPLRKWLLPGLAAAPAVLVLAVLLTRNLDVVGQASIASFQAVLAAADRVAPDEGNGGWSLKAPDGSVRFVWTRDPSRSPVHDLLLELDAQPFLDAGLDPGRLPESISFQEGRLTVGRKLGREAWTYREEATPLASYEQIVARHRDSIGYHAPMDHFNLDLGSGHLIEWAKDMGRNDKDLVFVLSPEPFIAAGLDPGAVEGWAFAKVPVNLAGKMTEADKLLKPFNLE